MDQIIEKRRAAAPCVTPQTVAWDGQQLWMSSRDLGMLYRVEAEQWIEGG